MTSRFAFFALALAFAPLVPLLACSGSPHGDGSVASALTGGCAVRAGDMVQVCFVRPDGTLLQGDMHDGGMPAVPDGTRVVFAFEPAWAPRTADVSAGGFASAFASATDITTGVPTPEDHPSNEVPVHVVSWTEDSFTIAFDKPLADGDGVDVEIDGSTLYRSRLAPTCDLPGEWCRFPIRFNARLWIGHAAAAPCWEFDASACNNGGPVVGHP